MERSRETAMIRMILVFLVVFGLWHFGIQTWRAATGKERLNAAKALTYSLFLAIITLITLIFIVITF